MSSNTNSINLEASSSQSLSISNASQTGLNVTGDTTFEFWLKPETPTEDAGVITKQGDYSTSGYSVEQDGLRIRTFYRDSSGNFSRFKTTNDVLTVGTWMHVAVVLDVSNPSCTIYIDGSSVAVTNVTAVAKSIGTSTADFSIGGRFNNLGPEYDGLLDEVRIWGGIRTAGEISDNYNIQLVGDEAGLISYWQLNDSLLDLTSNGNDLTNNNAATFSTDVPFPGDAPPTPSSGRDTIFIGPEITF